MIWNAGILHRTFFKIFAGVVLFWILYFVRWMMMLLAG